MFVCEKCIFQSPKKSNYILHLQTKKHRHIQVEDSVKYSGREAEGIRGNSRERSSSEFMSICCEKCRKPYKTRAGAWKHQLACRKDVQSSRDVNSYELRSPEFQGVAESIGRSKSAIFGRDEVSYENPRTPSAARPEYFTDSSGCSQSAIFRRDEVSYENETPTLSVSSPTSDMLNMIYDLVKQNQEIKEMLVKQNEQLMEYTNRPVIIQQHIQNNTTNHFNLNVFLQEKCKGAINMSDFVNNLNIEMGDLEMVGKIGYVEGISRIILNELRGLDIYTRPIHCTDTKRDTIYIKDRDKWTRDTEMNEHTKKVIEKVANKNLSKIPEWRRQNPGADIMDSNEHTLNMQIMIQSLGGLGGTTKEKTKRNYDKIIKLVSKEICVNKELLAVE
jgi:hypothetical protein